MTSGFSYLLRLQAIKKTSFFKASVTTLTVSFLFRVMSLIDCSKLSANLLFLLCMFGVFGLAVDWFSVLVAVTNEFVNWVGPNGTWKVNSKTRFELAIHESRFMDWLWLLVDHFEQCLWNLSIKTLLMLEYCLHGKHKIFV